MSPRHGHLSSHRVCIWFVSTEPLLGGLEKLLLMGFPIHVLNVTCVSDTVNLACLTFYPVWSKLFQTAFVQHIFSPPNQVLSSLGGNAMHIRPVAAALACVLKAGKQLKAGMNVESCWIQEWQFSGCGLVNWRHMNLAASELVARELAASELVARELAASELVARELAASELVARELAASELVASSFAANKLAQMHLFFNFWPQSTDIQKVATLRPNKKSEVEAWGPCRDQSLLAAGCEPRSGLVTPSSAMASRNPRASVRVSLALSLSALSDSKASLSRCSARAAFSKPLRSNGISSKNLATFCVSTKLSRAAPTRCTTSDSTCISSKLSRRSLGGSSSSLRWSSTSMAQSNHQIRCHGDLLTYVASLSMVTYWLTLHRFSRCLQKISAANSCCFHAFSCARKWSLNSQLL